MLQGRRLRPPFEMFSAAFTCSAGLFIRRWMSRSLPVPVSDLRVRIWNSPTDGPHVAVSSATSPTAPGLAADSACAMAVIIRASSGVNPPCSSSV